MWCFPPWFIPGRLIFFFVFRQECRDSLGHGVGGNVGLCVAACVFPPPRFAANAVRDRYSCHGGGGNQAWALTREGELRHDDHCLMASHPQREASFRECPEEGLNHALVRAVLLVF